MLLVLLLMGLALCLYGWLETSSVKMVLTGLISAVISIVVMVNIPKIPICSYKEEESGTYELFNNSMFYYSDNNGGYKLGEIDLENTIIYEDNNCTTPYVIEYVSRIKTTKFGFILIFITNLSETKNYEIHVPAGTMNQNVTIES